MSFTEIISVVSELLLSHLHWLLPRLSDKSIIRRLVFLGSHIFRSHSLCFTPTIFGEPFTRTLDDWWDIANRNTSCEAHFWPPRCVTCSQLLLLLLLPHLLLVFSLGVQTGLNAFSCLLESLPLWAFCWVVCTHTYYVGAGEDQHVGHKLWKSKEKADSLGPTKQMLWNKD